MSETESVFKIRDRVSDAFRLYGTPVPEPIFGEEPFHYHQRVLACGQSLLPASDAWSQVGVGRLPASALDGVEKGVIGTLVDRFKQPTGPLREASETCPRTGRVMLKWYGDPSGCWNVFAGPTVRRAQFTPGLGRGADSERGRALTEARAEVLRAAGL